MDWEERILSGSYSTLAESQQSVLVRAGKKLKDAHILADAMSYYVQSKYEICEKPV